MLVLSRNPLEALVIGDSIRVVVLEVIGNRVRLGIDAPREVPLAREETLHRAPRRAMAQVSRLDDR